MYLWAIYIFPGSVCLFGCSKKGISYRSWEHINRSQIHECRNWEQGRAVSFLGLFVSNFRCSADTDLHMTRTVHPITSEVFSPFFRSLYIFSLLSYRQEGYNQPLPVQRLLYSNWETSLAEAASLKQPRWSSLAEAASLKRMGLLLLVLAALTAPCLARPMVKILVILFIRPVFCLSWPI